MLKIISVGKIKDKNLRAIVDDYFKKIARFHKITELEVKDEPLTNNENEKYKLIEAQRILAHIKEDDFLILLDLGGKMEDSISFARSFGSLLDRGTNICFVIAGSLGAHKILKERANRCWKLSDLTFLHNIAKMIVLEQIYRSFKILNGQEYHK